MSNTFVTPRYRLLDMLGEGGMGRVYRAEDRLTGQLVALKEVILDEEDRPLGQLTDSWRSELVNLRLALTQEFRLMASLRHPNIVSVLDYGFTNSSQPFYTMELLANAQPITKAIDSTDERLSSIYLIQVLQALAYLHQRGILHRDLKPENILVSDGKVHILDFGLSANVADSSASENIVGSLLYMAPEVLDGASPTPISDLYAIGVVAYEIFAGRHPFYVPSAAMSIDDLINKTADVQSLNTSPVMKTVIATLLSKEPTARYASARAALAAFQAAASIPIEIESSTLRESYLQASRFVGRDSELEKLKQALTAANESRGSVWLIGGESGIGKSRLVDEFRIHALTAGAHVITGQAAREGGAPYQLWREVVAHLALSVDLSDATAAALQWIQPAIGTIIGRSFSSVVDDQSRDERIFDAVLTLFRKQPQTVALILEDLQWAADDLDLLKRLTTLLPSLKVLIVGSYRDDEMPGLPKELPEAHVLKLERLSEASLASLVESMIGSTQPHLFRFLHRETEGNIFFLVETLRTLAEDAGSLANIANHSLPVSIFTGGIQKIVERRLNQVTGSARTVLNLAAVIGRAIDLPLMQAAAPTFPLESWLMQCADASILEVQENQWRFAHDKLREGVLAQLNGDVKISLHRQVAECLEQVYGHDDARAGRLAYHWGSANVADKEYLACVRASRYYLQINLFNDARRFAERALALTAQQQDQDKQGNSPSARLEAITCLAPAYWQLGDYELAKPVIEQGLEIARELEAQTHFIDLSLMIGKIMRRQGETKIGKRHLQEGLTAARQIGDRYRVAQALLASITPLIDSDIAEAQQIARDALDIYRELGEELGEAYAIARLAITMIEIKDVEESRRLVTHARDIFLKYNVRSAYVSVLQDLISFELDAGNLEEAIALAEDGLRMSEEMGSKVQIATMSLMLAQCKVLLDKLEEAERSFYDAISIFRSINEVSWLAFTLAQLGYLLHMRNKFADAQIVLEEALTLSQATHTQEISCIALTNLSIVLCETGDLSHAKSTLRNALDLAQEWSAFELQMAVVEALLYYLSKTSQSTKLIEYSVFLLQHRRASKQMRVTARRCIQQVAPMMSDTMLAEAEQRGQSLTHNIIMNEAAELLANT